MPPSGSDENVLKSTVVMAAILFEFSKYYSIAHFMWVKCMVYELHLNKAVRRHDVSKAFFL